MPEVETRSDELAQGAPPDEGAGEDFLFHLYRGGELLHDGRVNDAQIELERALALRPSDPKAQDLLAIVYFRLGLFPRAITIYEDLVRAHPTAVEPRINLALAYLKTAQPARASVELERALDQNPTHSRAWGYLGLALQRLGDLDRASQAFVAGGHDAMAQRVLSMSPSGASSPKPDFHELGGADGVTEEAPSTAPAARATTWRPMAPDRPLAAPSEGRASTSVLVHNDAARPRSSAPVNGAPDFASITAVRLRDDLERSMHSAPTPASDLVRAARVVFSRERPVAVHPSGAVLVCSEGGFVARASRLRSITLTSETTSAPLKRRTRGRVLDEALGGAADPLIELVGRIELILPPEAGFALRPIVVRDEPLYLREDRLCGFERSIAFENGRLPVDDGDAIPMVQLRGVGTVIAALPESALAVEVVGGRRAVVRAHSVLGWTGRLVPRALSTNEPLGGSKGLVALAGEGMVLLDGR